MEDIYDDLNNYEDVNTVQELRIENQELKVKLEEHAAAMEKLQKDYDTLEMEFKKLEKNYSSLLKTARSEVERKTQQITQLNTEKDLMVLDALKSGKMNIRRNFKQGVYNPIKTNYEKPYKEKGNNKNKEDNVKQKNVDVKNDRYESTVLQTKDVPNFSTYNRNKIENAGAKVELSNNKEGNVKENIAHNKTELNEPPSTAASSIKDRRKSMPDVSMPIDKFSSDDELEHNYQTKNIRTDPLPMDKFDRRNIYRHSNKNSEASSMDDRGYNYHESSRDIYKSKFRLHDNSLFRGRDKYDVSLKDRRHYSPERGLKRQYREHRDDFYRQDLGRYQRKPLESPPPELYSRHQRRYLDHRSDYENRSHDYEKHRHHHEDKYSAKHRFSNDYDEPRTKRQKMESYGNPDTHLMEDRRHYHEKESKDKQPVPEFSPHEYDMLRQSCQSPDSVNTDAASAYPTKEILATAATPLEDPRAASERYVIKKENGKETLCAAVSKNIDIRPVQKSVWNLQEHVDMPVALVRRPSLCSDEFIKNIYSDIDNPMTNSDLSMESGEVRETEAECHKIHKPKEIHRDSHDFKISRQVTEDLSKQTINAEKVSKPNIAKYRIPKTGQNNKNTPASKMDVPIIDPDENVPHHKHVYRKSAVNDSFSKEIVTHKRKSNKSDDFLPSNTNCSKKESKNVHQNQATLTKIATVVDDLELSDDNSDHMDTNRRVVPEKVQKNMKLQLKLNETTKDSSVNHAASETRISSHDTETERTAYTEEIRNDVGKGKTKESDSTKNQKNKKKKSKSKDTSKDKAVEEIHPSMNAIHVPEKKTRSKKEKEGKSKETKEKFSDLFGDSNSLMTPEDLGIPSYLPISEDVQDAIDIKINQIIDAAPSIDKEKNPVQTQNSIEVKIQETTTPEAKGLLHKPNTEVEENKELVKDNKKKKSSKRNEEIIDPNNLPSPIVYENLNPGSDSNDPNVVKTVIISTGIQPEITYENNREITKPTSDVEINAYQNTTDINPISAVMEFKRQDIMKALATSTPQKEFNAVNLISDATTSANVEVSKAVATIPNAEQVVNQTNESTLETNDAPDVRIFVKRRRKVMKRPPMT